MMLWLQLLFCLVVIGYAGYFLSHNGELVTGISAITLADAPNIAVGNALGSTIFNLCGFNFPPLGAKAGWKPSGCKSVVNTSRLAAGCFNVIYLAVNDLLYTKWPLLASVDNSHAITAFTAVMMSTLVIVGIIFKPQQRAVLKLTWISLGLLLFYILNTWIQFQYGQ